MPDERQSLDSYCYLAAVKSQLKNTSTAGRSDFVFCVLPDSAEHDAHKAATILALNTVASLPAKNRPVILGACTRNKTDSDLQFAGYNNYQKTKTLSDTALFRVDRTTGFSYHNRVNYKVIATGK